MGQPRYVKMRGLRDVLWEAQEGRCWICERRMIQTSNPHYEQATIDHVFPRSKFKATGDIGLTLLAHKGCNGSRNDPWPTDEEIRKLVAIWKRVDRDWLKFSLSDVQAQAAHLRTMEARAEILSMYAGEAA